jgi:predicted nucleic acid-binding protein
VARELFYWDANAFLGLLNGETDKSSYCEAVIQQAQQGHVLIITSALTLAEVLFIKGQVKLDPAKRQKVETFFRAEYISVRNLTRAVSELARDVVWDSGIKPKDAIHVATAVFYKIPKLHTFDEPLIGKSGVSINDHTLVIEKPSIPHQMDLLGKSGETEKPN